MLIIGNDSNTCIHFRASLLSKSSLITTSNQRTSMLLSQHFPKYNWRSEEKGKTKRNQDEEKSASVYLKKFERPSFVLWDNNLTAACCMMGLLSFYIQICPLAFRMLTMKDLYICKRNDIFIVNTWVNKDFHLCFEKVVPISSNLNVFISLYPRGMRIL